MEPYYVLENSDGTSKVVHTGETVEEVATFSQEDEANQTAESLNESAENKANTEWLNKMRSEA